MTYNQKETCIEAINSLLTQTLRLDLILISDDCSTDGTYECIADYLKHDCRGEHIRLYQTEKNLGFVPHFNRVIKENCTETDLIYYNAGDDISEVNRIEEFYKEYAAKGNPRHFLGHSYVTSFGSGKEEILVPPIESIKHNRELCLIASAYHIGASQVFTGALFFDFGPILFDDCYEDLTLGYRALLKEAYHFLPQALLRYRVGGLSSWQKNPLEKKRGRLKSTLTQRAVDSMRSGDFEALSTIQDCYSQYGFSHLPHHDRVRIAIIGEGKKHFDIFDYSIADHFSLVSNVCEVHWETPANFLDSIVNSSTDNLECYDLIWIIAARLGSMNLSTLFEKIALLKKKSVMIDWGLTPSLRMLFPSLEPEKINELLSKNAGYMRMHVANPDLYTQLGDIPMLSDTTYIAPLQNIDGHDPCKNLTQSSNGLVVVIGSDQKSQETLTIVQKAHSLISPSPGQLPSSLSILISDDGKIRKFMKSSQIESTKQNFNDLINPVDFDYMIIISENSPKYSAQVQYLWSLSATNCIATFINAEAPPLRDLIHGINYLSVDSNISAWSTLFEIVQTRFGVIQELGSNARRDAYFNYSIQKRIDWITRVLNPWPSKGFFNKFLPL